MRKERQYYIYIITNFENGTLYTGVTNNLVRRVYEHKNKLVEGFTKKYDLTKLVYYEVFDSIEYAILREKQIKGGSRKKKLNLINNFNKEWKDLYETII
jgi:putative endonuclease